MLVSFIIPAYNAADTIGRCLDSIYSLSLKRNEFEVIVIDDASTDDTCDVIERYVRLIDNRCIDDRLILLRQKENHRQGAARNRGVTVAKGEYICFVDADDTVAEGIVGAIRVAKEKDADMVPFHYVYVDAEGKKIGEKAHLHFERGEVFTGIEMELRQPYWNSGPVAFVYKKSFLESVHYPFCEDVMYEDADFVMKHMYYAKRMTYWPECAYKVYYNSSSTTHAISHQKLADYFFLGMRMLSLYECITDERVKELTNAGEREFADHILDGACYSLRQTFRRLYRMGSVEEMALFYKRIDNRFDRKALYSDKRLRTYYWNGWTAVCLRYPKLAILIAGVIGMGYRGYKRVRSNGNR